MKKKLGLLAVLCLLFAGFIFVRYVLLDSGNNQGRVKILSSPAAGVFLNNVVIGKTTFEDKYKVGEYLLKLIPEESATQTASWQHKIKVYKNALTYVSAELGSSDLTTSADILTITKMDSTPKSNTTGEIYVDSEPTGAIVYLDNDEKGVSSLILSDVPQGDHELSVFMPGFFRRTQKINVTAGYRTTIYMKLAADKNQSTSFKIDDKKDASGSATPSSSKKSVLIKDTPTGWLRVREEPSINASESAKVNPGKTFAIIEEKEGWYKIEYESGKQGWISSSYAEKQ